MLSKEKIERIVNDHLDGTDKFLVSIDVSTSNIIDVYVDGDNGISIGECVKISRLIEGSFDRENEDFELRVSSPGLDKPFKMLRQYKKYINREIRLELAEGEKRKGKLLSVNDKEVEIEIRKGKKSGDVIHEIIRFDRIIAAKPEISFK